MPHLLKRLMDNGLVVCTEHASRLAAQQDWETVAQDPFCVAAVLLDEAGQLCMHYNLPCSFAEDNPLRSDFLSLKEVVLEEVEGLNHFRHLQYVFQLCDMMTRHPDAVMEIQVKPNAFGVKS